MILVVHVDDVFAVGKERCDQFGEDLNRMVVFTRQRGSEAEDFTADVHGRVGREV